MSNKTIDALVAYRDARQEPRSYNLTCSGCGRLFQPVNNGDGMSPCCTMPAIEEMSMAELQEALIEEVIARSIK